MENYPQFVLIFHIFFTVISYIIISIISQINLLINCLKSIFLLISHMHLYHHTVIKNQSCLECSVFLIYISLIENKTIIIDRYIEVSAIKNTGSLQRNKVQFPELNW